jgi:2-keto-3-deoxygluconate permease
VAAAVCSGPLVPALVLGLWSGRAARVPWLLAAVAVGALVLGLLLGDLLPASRRLLAYLTTPLLLLMSAAMGWAIPLESLARETPRGVVVAVISGAATGVTATLLLSGVLRRPAGIGWAAAAPAAVSVTVPTLLALADPTWTQWVPVATAQTAVAVLVGAVGTSALGAVLRPAPAAGD